MDNKKKKITLTNMLFEEIAAAMDDNSYEHKWYLDIQNEETILVSDYSDDDPELSESIEEGYNERFFSIPQRESREGWEQMERFIHSLDDKDEQTPDLLQNAISGRGAFGRFKDALYRTGLNERWFEFKGREDRKETLEWLQSLGLITGEDIKKGMQLYEDWLVKRKRQEEDIANMTRGTRIKCIYNDGQTDKITPGKTYDVLDERKEHLLVRIKDDRGKECWLPKSHFELLHLRKV
jgi:hypothetical protein